MGINLHIKKKYYGKNQLAFTKIRSTPEKKTLLRAWFYIANITIKICNRRATTKNRYFPSGV